MKFSVWTPHGTWHFQQKRNKLGRLKWRWWVSAENGEIVALCPPTGYHNRQDMLNGATISGAVLAAAIADIGRHGDHVIRQSLVERRWPI